MKKLDKTTICGILAIAVQLAHIFPPAIPYIGPVTAILTAAGLYHAKDK